MITTFVRERNKQWYGFKLNTMLNAAVKTGPHTSKEDAMTAAGRIPLSAVEDLAEKLADKQWKKTLRH